MVRLVMRNKEGAMPLTRMTRSENASMIPVFVLADVSVTHKTRRKRNVRRLGTRQMGFRTDLGTNSL